MRHKHGFSLVELMIVVAIIGLLSVVAVPAYNSYSERTNRSAAQQFMLDVANRAEQYRLDARQYPDALSDLDVTAPDDVSDHYGVSLSSDNTATPPTYTITATPHDSDLSTLTLDSFGDKTPADEW